jgi:hypothetical protein
MAVTDVSTDAERQIPTTGLSSNCHDKALRAVLRHFGPCRSRKFRVIEIKLQKDG